MQSKLLRLWFADGWFFLVPWLALYLIGYALRIPVPTLRLMMLGLMGATAVAWAAYLVPIVRRTFNHPGHFWQLGFWVALFSVCYLPGAYLEFPSDPWEHVARATVWGGLPYVGDHLQWKKFVYFINWCVLHPFLPDHAFAILDLISAAWESLFFYQMFRFCRRLVGSTKWAYVHVLAAMLLFGSTVYNFRYYALSSTPLAYIAYLAMVLVLLDFANRRWVRAWQLPFLFLLIAFNHLQELMLAIVAAFTILTWKIATGQNRRLKLGWLTGLAATFVLSVGFGYWMVNYRMGTYYTRPWFFLITTHGGLQLSPPILRFYDTYGAHGLAGVAFATLLVFGRQLVGYLTLAPIVIWKTSFIVAFATRFFATPDQFYRIIYLIPPSVSLVEGLRWVAARGRVRRFAPALIAVIVILISIPLGRPWRGRLWSQVNQPDRDYHWLVPAAGWIRENYPLSRDCEFVSDNVSDFVVNTLLERAPFANRHNPIRYALTIDSPAEFARQTEGKKICGILALRRELAPPVKKSVAAEQSKHWDDFKGDYLALSSERLITVGDRLGWRRYEVPPFYYLFAPPSH